MLTGSIHLRGGSRLDHRRKLVYLPGGSVRVLPRSNETLLVSADGQIATTSALPPQLLEDLRRHLARSGASLPKFFTSEAGQLWRQRLPKAIAEFWTP